MEACSTVTISDIPTPEFAPFIQWTIGNVVQPRGPTVTIPADLSPTPPTRIVYTIPLDMARNPDGSIFMSSGGQVSVIDQHQEVLSFTFANSESLTECLPVYTFDSRITENQGSGGPTLEPGDILTVTESTGSNLINLIKWTINGEESVGPTVTIPDNIMPGVYQGTVDAPLTVTVISGGLTTFVTSTEIPFEFTIAEPAPEFTIDPILNVNQDGGGATLEACSTVTISDIPTPEFAPFIQWAIDGIQQPRGPTVTIPADLSLSSPNRIAYTIPLDMARNPDGSIFISPGGQVSTINLHQDELSFTFTNSESLTECPEPVYTFDSRITENQGSGGPTLEPGDILTVTESTGSNLINHIDWSINGEESVGPTVTIPDNIMPGVYQGTVDAPLTVTVISGGLTTFVTSTEIPFEFTIAEPAPEPVYTFDPQITENQGAGGPTLRTGDTLTVTESAGSDLINQITWTINGVESVGPTVTIPAGLTPGVHQGMVVAPVITGNPITHDFEFTIAPPDNEPNPVYTFDPLIFSNQVNGGLTLEPGSTITVTEPVGPNLVDLIEWTIDGVSSVGPTVTIPTGLTPGEHEGQVVVIDMYALEDDGTTISSSTPKTMTFKFTIADPYTFDPMIFDTDDLTLALGSTITVTEETESGFIDQIAWTINGVESTGSTVTIPTDLIVGEEYDGKVITLLAVDVPHERDFKFTIADPYTFDPMIFDTDDLTLALGSTITVTEETESGFIDQIAWTINGVESTGSTVTIPTDLIVGEEYDGKVITLLAVDVPHERDFKFTIADPYTFDPMIFDTDDLTLALGSTITVTEESGSDLVDQIAWIINGVESTGSTVTIPTDLIVGEEYDGNVITLLITGGMSDRDFTFTIVEPQRSSGGGNDWQKKPTFGKSYENTQFQVVENGFVFNGNTLNIVDNWHTEFLKTSSIIGDTNNVKIKVYTDKLLSSATLQLGVPEIGKSSDAETGIYVMFDRNYTSVNDYDIVKIMHEQNEPLIDADETLVSIAPSHCTSDSVDMKCHTISFDFTIMAPLKHDVVAITATDNDRRSTTTFINEGVEFLGDSLLESATYNIHQKLGNQAPSETITLTQQDRRYQVWEDNNGYLWTQNDFGTFTQITHPDFVRYDDASSSVMTRINSAFDAMILDEQEKASLIFDSMTIQGTLDDSFTHVYPTGDKRDNMEILLLDEEARILLLLE